MGMESVYALGYWIAGGLLLVGLVAYISGKITGNDEFSALEKLVAAYVGVAVLVWMYEGYLGNPPLTAMWTSLAWPLTAYDWGQAQLK